jgi:hypothetical protein
MIVSFALTGVINHLPWFAVSGVSEERAVTVTSTPQFQAAVL